MDEKCCFSISLVIRVILHLLYGQRQIRFKSVEADWCVSRLVLENRLGPDLDKSTTHRRSIMNSIFPGPFVFIQLPTFVIFCTETETETLIPRFHGCTFLVPSGFLKRSSSAQIRPFVKPRQNSACDRQRRVYAKRP